MGLSFVLRALTAGLLLACAVLAEIKKENGVLVLTDDNFNEAIEAHPDGLLVEMYAPWCGHCKALTPEYEAAAKELAEKGFEIAKLDATEHSKAAEKYEVQGFPTIKYIGKNKVLEYQGGRTAADIVNYVIKKSGPPAVPLDSADAVKKFAEEADAVVVGFLSDAKLAATFTEVAGGNDDLRFGIVTDTAVAKAFGVADGNVAVLKNFDEKKNELPVTAATTAEDITKFISTYTLRLVTTFSPETARSIFGGSVSVHSLFFAPKLDAKLEADVSAVAKENRGKMLFVYIPPEEARVAEFFGITEEQQPTMVIADMEGGIKKYLFGSERTLDSKGIAAFVSDFFAGNLKPDLKSEEPAPEDLAGAVKIIKGKSFKDIVVDSDKDVFVKFYAPWCGHCKALAPKWEEAAEKLKGFDSVVLGDFDSTANEIDYPGVDVQGFPTLLFFKKGQKAEPISFDGARDVAGLLTFIKENASDKLDIEIPAPESEAEAEEEEEEDVKDEL